MGDERRRAVLGSGNVGVMTDSSYKIGDAVEVEMPDGFRLGRVVDVLPNFAWSGESKYSIHGDGFITIASARVMRPASACEVA